MSNFKQSARKVGKFLKKNGYIFLIVICIAAIGTMIGLAVANNNAGDTGAVIEEGGNNTPSDPTGGNTNDPSDPTGGNGNDNPVPVVDTQKFYAPVNGTMSDKYVYSTVSLVYFQSLNAYKTHTGLDFYSETDQNVYAVCDGVVSEVVTNDPLLGNYVVITHSNDYVSKYFSLDSQIGVTAGQTVKRGDTIGAIGTSYKRELDQSAHLHFEMYHEDLSIDPLSVLVLNEK